MTDPIETAIAAGRTRLTEAEGKALLSEAGIETPDNRLATDPDAAADAAEELGYPVVCKVSAPGIVHKSEWGGGVGVALGLDSRAAVRDAARSILDEADGEGLEADVLVEEAVDADTGTEVIVGGLRDPSFGPVVLVGLGGVFTEVYEDVSHRIAPITPAEARAAIEELTAARLLSGYRGRPAAAVDALAAAVATVGDLIVQRDSITEIDVNPVLASPDGAVALDAVVVLTGEDDWTEADET